MVGVVADEGEVVVALAGPFVEAALDVACPAYFEEDRLRAGASPEFVEDSTGWAPG